MVNSVDCDGYDAAEVTGRYVAGALSTDERDAFEAHLLQCERCRREVELAEAVHEAFRREEMEGREPPSGAGGSSWPYWFRIAAMVALAAGLVLAGLVLFRSPEPPSPLIALGQVTQPPIYLGASVRSPATSADSLFSRAMDAYVGEDFGAAVDGLEAAVEAEDDGPPVYFFLGAALLMQGRPGEAIDAFEAVEAAGDSPYRAEAWFYRAKALLRLGRAEDAIEALHEAAGSKSSIAERAAALSDSVSRITK